MPLNLIKFQELILQYQYQKEKIYEEAAASLDDDAKCVIIYDRGLLDNKAYINQQLVITSYSIHYTKLYEYKLLTLRVSQNRVNKKQYCKKRFHCVILQLINFFLHIRA